MNTYIVLLLIISVTLLNNCSNAFGGRKILEKDYISFDVNSFLNSSCRSSVRGQSRPASLEVMHKYGHCSKLGLNGGPIEPPSLEEILEHDQIRVSTIHRTRRAFHPENSNYVENDVLGESKAAAIPAKSGVTLGSANYIVSVGLGTPAKDVTLEFDTGSSLTWTQCQPCVGHCYTQTDSIFDPSASTSYSNLSCNSDQCSQLSSNVALRGCSKESTCEYFTSYGDSSNSKGFLGNEVLTFTPNDVISNFTFGCGENNDGTVSNLFGTTAGLLGLGRDTFSVVSQTAEKYGKYFSYCLPTPQSGSNGHLTFGKDNGAPGDLAYTTLVNGGDHYYYVNIVGISVGGTQLAISPSVFQSGEGTVIDSGTVITQLPTTAYAALRDAFKQQMTAYTLLAQGVGNLDTCYDFGDQTTIQVPTISFIFEGNVQVDIVPGGILIRKSTSVFCLAFQAGNMGIFGNLLQQTYEVAYDVAGGRLGFAPKGCS